MSSVLRKRVHSQQTSDVRYRDHRDNENKTLLGDPLLMNGKRNGVSL